MRYTQDEIVDYARHLDRRLNDEREYPTKLISRFINVALVRLSDRIAPFKMIENYHGDGFFAPTYNVVEYDRIGYENQFDSDYIRSPIYTINRDRTVSIDESSIVTNDGQLMFEYYYVPDVLTDKYIDLGDSEMVLFEVVFKIEIYKYTRDLELLGGATKEFNYLINSSYDRTNDAIPRDARVRGMV